jgi:protein SCO1/2
MSNRLIVGLLASLSISLASANATAQQAAAAPAPQAAENPADFHQEPQPNIKLTPVAEGVLGSDVWGAGYWPDCELTTHEGKKVRFFSDMLKDKVVVLNFIYTACPDACPLETAKLAEVAEVLGDQMGEDVFFYSISIDPQTDTPAVLADYAKRFRAGKGWQFLTGSAEDIKLIRLKCGLMDLSGQQRSDHSLDMLVGNQKTGRWMKQSAFENPYMLATVIGDWLHNYKRPRGERQGYEDAPALHNLTKGESLFRTRCSACHVIGKGDGLTRQGPNLMGVVERRDRKWLERWLREPDVMLAEKDPIATQLFEAFNKVAMPNLRLNDAEIVHLIDFMKTQSRIAEMEEGSVDMQSALKLKPVASCCAKKSGEDPAAQKPAGETEGATSVAESKGGSRSGLFGLSTTSMVSIGLGLIGLLTAALRRRS